MNDQNYVDSFPARLDVIQTARLLGVGDHDIPILVAVKLLTPLGSPANNAPKYFAKITVMEHAGDVRWLDKATRCIGRYWKAKRERRKSPAIANDENEEKHSVKPPVPER